MKKSLKMFCQFAVMTSLLLPAALLAAESKIPAGKWIISTGGDNSAASNYCASELQELLAHRIGTKLPVVKDKKLPSGPVILLDRTDPKLDWQSFRIVRKKDVIRIIGGSPVGTLFGVYEFLQRYCDVWTVAPGVVYAPKGQPLVFGDFDLTMKPAVIKRELYHAGYYYTLKDTREKWLNFNYRNRLSSFYPSAFTPYTDTHTMFPIPGPKPAILFMIIFPRKNTEKPIRNIFRWIRPESGICGRTRAASSACPIRRWKRS